MRESVWRTRLIVELLVKKVRRIFKVGLRKHFFNASMSLKNRFWKLMNSLSKVYPVS